MKKTLYCMFAALAVCFAFTSCGDDDIDVDHGTHAQKPETALAGTYTGSYTVYNADGVTAESTADATVTIAAGESAYTITLTSNCPEVAAATGSEETPLNCTWANDDIKFWGPTTAGTTTGYLNSSALNGTLVDGVMTLRFAKTVRQGRKTVTNFYQFTGTK